MRPPFIATVVLLLLLGLLLGGLSWSSTSPATNWRPMSNTAAPPSLEAVPDDGVAPNNKMQDVTSRFVQRRDASLSVAQVAPQCREGRPSAGVLYSPSAEHRVDLHPQITISLITRAALPSVDVPVWPSTKWLPDRDPPTRTQVPYVACQYRSVLLAYAASYDGKILRGFVTSFQQYHSPCEVLVLFGDSVDLDFVRDDDKGNVQIENRLMWEAQLLPHFTNHTRREVVRIGVLSLWLREYGVHFRYAVTCDARDVIFFGNVFVGLRQNRVTGLFTVAEAHNFAKQSLNRFWVNRFTGNDTAAEFVSKLSFGGRPLRVLCSGLFGGTSEALVDYLALFDSALRSVPDRGVLTTPGVDQGAHNYLLTVGVVWARYPHPVLLLDGDFGPFTHWFPPERHAMLIDVSNRILNCHLEPYALVHQFDRYWQLWVNLMRPYDMWPDARRDKSGCDVSERVPPSHRTVLDVAPTSNDTQSDGTDFSLGRRGGYDDGPPLCLQHNALVIAFLEVDNGLFDLLLRSFHRYHTWPCDHIVAFVNRSTVSAWELLASSSRNVRLRVWASSDPRVTMHEWLLSDDALAYRWLVVAEDWVQSHAAIHSNIFRAMALGESTEERAVGFVPFLPFNVEDVDRAMIELLVRASKTPVADCLQRLRAYPLTIEEILQSMSTAAFSPLVYAGSATAVQKVVAFITEQTRVTAESFRACDAAAQLIATSIWQAHALIPRLVLRKMAAPHRVVLINATKGFARRMWLDGDTRSAGPTDSHRRPMICQQWHGARHPIWFSHRAVSLVVGLKLHSRGSLSRSMWAFWRRAYPRRMPSNVSAEITVMAPNGTMID